MHREIGTAFLAGPAAKGKGIRAAGARVQDVLPTVLHIRICRWRRTWMEPSRWTSWGPKGGERPGSPGDCHLRDGKAAVGPGVARYPISEEIAERMKSLATCVDTCSSDSYSARSIPTRPHRPCLEEVLDPRMDVSFSRWTAASPFCCFSLQSLPDATDDSSETVGRNCEAWTQLVTDLAARIDPPHRSELCRIWGRFTRSPELRTKVASPTGRFVGSCAERIRSVAVVRWHAHRG
jgi:hypothetical protein